MKKILKWGVIAFVALIVIVAIAGGGGSGSEEEPAAKQTTTQKAEKSPEKAEETKPEPTLTSGQENALAAAEMYLDTMPFSQSGLVKQLKFDDYAEKDAVFAAKNVGADWNEQAERAAENYLDTMPFSRDALVDQLKFDGYTPAQAAHGADSAL